MRHTCRETWMLRPGEHTCRDCGAPLCLDCGTFGGHTDECVWVPPVQRATAEEFAVLSR